MNLQGKFTFLLVRKWGDLNGKFFQECAGIFLTLA